MFCDFKSWTTALVISSVGKNQLKKVQLSPSGSGILRKLATIAASLVTLQIILGVATFKLHLQVEPLTITHQAVGASLLGVLVAFTVLAIKDTRGAIKN